MVPDDGGGSAHTVVDNLIEFLRVEADRLQIKQTLQGTHAADIAEALADMPEDTKRMIMGLLDHEQTVAVLDEVDEEDAKAFIEERPVEELARILDDMPTDEAADILDHAEPEKAELVLTRVSPETAEAVRELRSYPPDAAGGIMTTEFLWVKPDEKAGAVLARLREEVENLETVRDIFVCRDDMKLKGVLTVEMLLQAEANQPARAIMDQATITVGPYADQEICARYMQKYDLTVLPVIDLRRRMIGIITVDDILEVLSEEASEDMYRLAGVGDAKPLEHGTLVRAWGRLPWFIVTLLGMSALGYIIRSFQTTIVQVVAVSFFIPAIMGLGGNVGIQSATITCRGLGTGEIAFKDFFWMLRREILVALIIGTVCSAALAGVAYGMMRLGMNEPPVAAHGLADAAAVSPAATEDRPLGLSAFRFALTVGVAMFCGIMGSVLLGTSVPMLCDRIGVDPAVASGPFVTTLIDIGTQTIYLGLATWLLLG